LDGRGSETLLLVEDDDAVRTISTIALENAGFRVLAADSATNAITFAKPRIAQVDLLITDVVMPRMGGREQVARIQALREMKCACNSSDYPMRANLARWSA